MDGGDAGLSVVMHMFPVQVDGIIDVDDDLFAERLDGVFFLIVEYGVRISCASFVPEFHVTRENLYIADVFVKLKQVRGALDG